MYIRKIAAKSHQGPHLPINEDSVDYDIDENIFMLVDCFGGVGAGDILANTLKSNIFKYYGQIAEDPEATLPFFYSPKYQIEGNALINSVLLSHKKLFNENMSKCMSSRAGASGVFIAAGDNLINILSVGNCSAYYLSNDRFTKLFIEDDFKTNVSDFTAHSNFIPMNAVGLYSNLHFQFKEVKFKENDQILILSDGIANFFSSLEIEFILKENTQDFKTKIDTFIALANERGNLDNQSVMILEF